MLLSSHMFWPMPALSLLRLPFAYGPWKNETISSSEKFPVKPARENNKFLSKWKKFSGPIAGFNVLGETKSMKPDWWGES